MSKLEAGKELFEENKYEEALTLFTTYLSENNNHGDALFFRGLCYRKTGRFQESINDLTALIGRLPEEADLYSERGVSYFHLKDYKTALLDMDKAVELQPENPYRYSSRAYIKAYIDIDGAIADYEKTIELDPKDDIAYNNMGLLSENKGKYKQAKQSFIKSDELSGYNPNKTVENQDEHKNLKNKNIGVVMLDVFRNKATRKEYFNFIKDIFKRID